MRIITVIVIRIAVMLGLLVAGFAVGFPLGQGRGFDTGSEWAIVQAEIAAREAGLSLPVSLREGQIHVIVRQPPGLYKRAQQQAARSDGHREISRTFRVDFPVGIEAEEYVPYQRGPLLGYAMEE